MELEAGVRTRNRALMDAAWERWRKYYGGGKVLCCNCGETTGAEATEMDHSVPLIVGGYDVITNMVPLCHKCHALKTIAEKDWSKISERIKAGQIRSDKMCGKPRAVPENYKELLNDFIFCRIGKKELGEKWGVETMSRKEPGKKKPFDVVHLVDRVWYKDYLRELGIKKVDNRIDIVYNRGNNRSVVAEGEYVGTITYLDGRTVDIYYGEPIEQAN